LLPRRLLQALERIPRPDPRGAPRPLTAASGGRVSFGTERVSVRVGGVSGVVRRFFRVRAERAGRSRRWRSEE
jgi:hypothetical protein